MEEFDEILEVSLEKKIIPDGAPIKREWDFVIEITWKYLSTRLGKGLKPEEEEEAFDVL